MEQVQFDTAGFALTSGYILVNICNSDGIYTHSEEQWISEGCGLAANAYLEQPPVAKQGFAIIRCNNGWEYIADHRGETVYSTLDRQPIEITALGDYPENSTTIKPDSDLAEWNGSAWVITEEKRLALLESQRQQTRNAINTLRDKKINGGVYVPAIDKWIDSDERAVRNLLSVKATFDLFGDDLDIVWTCADNSNIKMTKEVMLQIWQAMQHNINTNHGNAISHKNALEQSENPLEYDYSGGWTQTYEEFVNEQV